MNDPSQFLLSGDGLQTNITLPQDQLCHYITDDQLEKLGEMRRDLTIEICLASAGIFFGSVVPAFDGFYRFNDAPRPATPTDLVSMMICFSAFIVALLTGWQWRKLAGYHSKLVEDIRNRPRVPVKIVANE